MNLTVVFTPSVIYYRKSDYALVYALHHPMNFSGLTQLLMKEEYGFKIRMTNAMLVR